MANEKAIRIIAMHRTESTVAGSVESVCVECGAAVMLAPASVTAMLKHPSAEPWCLECFVKQAGKEPIEIVTTDDQEAEMRQHSGPNGAENFFRSFGLPPKPRKL